VLFLKKGYFVKQIDYLQQVIYLAAMVVAIYVVVVKAAKKKDGFMRHFSRGDYMRKLNKKMERELEDGKKEKQPGKNNCSSKKP